MNATKRIFKFQRYDSKKLIRNYWAIILIMDLLLYGISIYFDSREGNLGTFNEVSSIISINIIIIIWFFIGYGMFMHGERFSLAHSFGVTRKDFYKSAVIDNLLLVGIFSVIHGILQFLEIYIVESLGKKLLLEVEFLYTANDSLLFIIMAVFMFYLVYLSIFNLIGVLYYTHGYKYVIGMAIVLFVLTYIIGAGNLISTPIDKLTIFLSQSLIIITCYSLGYLFIKKSNIKK